MPPEPHLNELSTQKRLLPVLAWLESNDPTTSGMWQKESPNNEEIGWLANRKGRPTG
jgi:hypothetical protein